MRKAYDIILSDYVDAETAAKGEGFEKYRYKCARCWEEVYLCAAYSSMQATHFRHRSGNNNVECDNYLGNRHAIIRNALSHQSIRDKIEFYFSSSSKIFSIGIKFNTDEISSYEQKEEKFQVKTSPTASPSIYVPINHNRFYPDTSEYIPISNFSWKYYVSTSSVFEPVKFEMFRKDKRGFLYPSFFKIQAEGDDNDFRAKFVRSDKLYTNTPYFILFTHSHYTLSFEDDVQVGKELRFRTMDRDFVGLVVIFTRKTARIEEQLKAWDYRLLVNETLTLIWPPSTFVNESMLICKDYAYLFSSFELQAHVNINVHSDDIIKLSDGISKVSINDRTKIYKRNAELVLDKYKCEEKPHEYDTIYVKQDMSKKFLALDDNTYFFNRSGVYPMNKGMSVMLTQNSEVRHYSFGYLDSIITLDKNSITLVGDHLIQEIQRYYKRTEDFLWDDYELIKLNDIAIKHLESCEKAGLINSAVKRFIREGRI